MSLLQLVYTSTARGRLGSTELDELYSQSQRNNRRDEVTGLLMTDGDRYLQALEGAKEPVENAFLRIISDHRHHGLILLSRRLIGSREFGHWDMARYTDDVDLGQFAERMLELTRDAPDFIRKSFTDLITGRASR